MSDIVRRPEANGAMVQIRFSHVEYDDHLDGLAARVPEFVEACLVGVDPDLVGGQWAQIVPGFVRGAVQALGFQTGARHHSCAADRIKDELLQGFGLFDLGEATGASGAEQDGFDAFMDWLARPDDFRDSRLRDRLLRSAE